MSLSSGKMFATIAVKDLEVAKKFYGGKLGLNQTDQSPDDGLMYNSAIGQLFVYTSSTAGTNQATCASWKVNNIESEVNDLKTKGITFEHYDIPGATWEGDISVMGSLKAAWFKDPDGNILGINN